MQDQDMTEKTLRPKNDAELVAKYRGLLLTLIPRGRFLSETSIVEKAQATFPSGTQPTGYALERVLALLSDEGALLRRRMRYDYGYAVPTAKLREERAAEDAKRTAALKSEARLNAAAREANEALRKSLGPNVTSDHVGWGLGTSLMLGLEQAAQLLTLAGMAEAAEAVRAYHEAYETYKNLPR